MENHEKQVVSEGENMDTSSPKCYSPNAPYTSYPNPTCVESCYPTVCGGECYTSQYTCGVTACDNTCQSTCQTCESQPTCESTCPSTCEQTCNQPTCHNCPPAVEGTVYHYYWGYKENYWGSYSSNRIVKQMMYPYKHVGFSEDDGYYFCDEWGQPAQQLLASGRIAGTPLTDQRGKPHQDPGELIVIDFECVR